MEISLIKDKLAWSYLGQVVEVENIDLIQKRYFPKCEMVVALIGSNVYKPEKIVGYTIEGKLVFASEPPEGFTFAYLSDYADSSIAVVCGVSDGGQKNHKWGEYFFDVNPKNGVLTKAGIAR